MRKDANLVRARNIADWGGAFRKPRGTYVYLRISDASAKHFKLDPSFIYGVTSNGNMTKVPLDAWVIPEHIEAMIASDGVKDES